MDDYVYMIEYYEDYWEYLNRVNEAQALLIPKRYVRSGSNPSEEGTILILGNGKGFPNKR